MPSSGTWEILIIDKVDSESGAIGLCSDYVLRTDLSYNTTPDVTTICLKLKELKPFGVFKGHLAVAVILNQVYYKSWLVVDVHPMITFCKFHKSLSGGSWNIMVPDRHTNTHGHEQKHDRSLAFVSGFQCWEKDEGWGWSHFLSWPLLPVHPFIFVEPVIFLLHTQDLCAPIEPY